MHGILRVGFSASGIESAPHDRAERLCAAGLTKTDRHSVFRYIASKFLTLPLASELDALRGGNAKLGQTAYTPCELRRFHGGAPTTKEASTRGASFASGECLTEVEPLLV